MLPPIVLPRLFVDAESCFSLEAIDKDCPSRTLTPREPLTDKCFTENCRHDEAAYPATLAIVLTNSDSGFLQSGISLACSSDPCQHGGTCVESCGNPDQFHCDCTEDYHGKYCDIHSGGETYAHMKAKGNTQEKPTLESRGFTMWYSVSLRSKRSSTSCPFHRKKCRYTWLRPFAIRPQCFTRLQPSCFATRLHNDTQIFTV